MMKFASPLNIYIYACPLPKFQWNPYDIVIFKQREGQVFWACWLKSGWCREDACLPVTPGSRSLAGMGVATASVWNLIHIGSWTKEFPLLPLLFSCCWCMRPDSWLSGLSHSALAHIASPWTDGLALVWSVPDLTLPGNGNSGHWLCI